MADRSLPQGIPPGAIMIIRNAQATGTLYTVPAGRRLHVVSAWCAIGQPNAAAAAGQLEVVASAVVGDAAGARSLVGSAVGDNGGQVNSNSVDVLDVPVAAAGTVALTRTGAAASTINGGFAGWEEPVLPGLPV